MALTKGPFLGEGRVTLALLESAASALAAVDPAALAVIAGLVLDGLRW